MNKAEWEKDFAALFRASVKRYQNGHQKAGGLIEAEGKKFLLTIGYTEQEFFDFVEDFARGGEPTLESALAIAAVRRDYFLHEQKGEFSAHLISVQDLPPKDAEIEGIVWLPRIIPKAEAKLRGEMPPELMYGCGGDRRFFKTNGIDPAEFLRQTRNVKGDYQKLIAWVKNHEEKA